ncbi:helix-hairpin-helix domain-containing protein [Cohnella cellulosilytica]|uniref:Helix-hairpin-helix domain-containing protein n=1 Tax=Cohnella cellulosilytica TaxID=986710 RepID=A0ABW2FJ47_9BACL
MTETRQSHPLPEGLPRPTLRALAAAGITTLEEIAERSEAELLKLHGFGPKSIRLLRPALEEIGLSFAER